MASTRETAKALAITPDTVATIASADFDHRHHQRKCPDQTIAGNVHHKGEHQQSNTQQRHQQAARRDIEQLQAIGAKRPRDQALVDDHGKIHEQGTENGGHPGAVRFFQIHDYAAGRGIGIGHFNVGVGAESDNYRRHQKGDGKQVTGQFGHLSGQRKDAGTDHHPGAHGDSADKRQTVCFILFQ